MKYRNEKDISMNGKNSVIYKFQFIFSWISSLNFASRLTRSYANDTDLALSSRIATSRESFLTSNDNLSTSD